MAKMVKVVTIDEKTRDLVQRLHIEYYQKEKVVKGLLEDHQFDDDDGFLESNIFKTYEHRAEKALYAYEVAQREMEQHYLPEEFKGMTNYKWTLDYDSCELTYESR